MNVPLRILSALTLGALGACGGEVGIGQNNPDVLNTSQGVDIFEQRPRPKVDSLWVVDGSASMEAPQGLLGPIALDYLDNLDSLEVSYQVGVIRPDLSDPEGPVLRGNPWILTPSTPNADLAFLNNLDVGAGDAGLNQGLGAAIQALSPPLSTSENRGFSRSGATLEVVFVSDSDDSSKDPTTGLILDPKVALETFRTLKAGAPLRISAIAGPSPGGCDAGDIQATPATRYLSLVEDTEGDFLSLCAMEAGQVSPSDAIPERLRSFELTEVPSSQALSVRVDDELVAAAGYSLTGSTLTFAADATPDYGSVIRVTYVYEKEESP